MVALQEKRRRFCRTGTAWFTCTTQPQLYFLPILLLKTKVTIQKKERNKQQQQKTQTKTSNNKNTTLRYLNAAPHVNDAVLLPLAHRTVTCYFLCQHRTWTLVKCFESEPGTNFFFFASFPSLLLFVLKSFESTVSDWDIDVLLAGPL